MNDVNLGWLCGMIDGEGNFAIKIRLRSSKNGLIRPTFYCHLTIVNSNRNMIDRCQQITGMGKIYERTNKQGTIIYSWRIGSNPLRKIIPLIKPHCSKINEIKIIERMLQITALNRGCNLRPNEVIEEQLQLRKDLISLHGLPAKKLSKRYIIDDNFVSVSLKEGK